MTVYLGDNNYIANPAFRRGWKAAGPRFLREVMEDLPKDPRMGRAAAGRMLGAGYIHRCSGIAVLTRKDGGDPIEENRNYIDMLRKESDGRWLMARHVIQRAMTNNK